MDLNHMIFREGEERLRAGAAGCDASRAAHAALADLYRDRVDVRRRSLLGISGLGPDLAPPRL